MMTTATLLVLIVEDEPRMRQLLIDVLPDMGFQVAAARTAEQAAAMLRENDADILMLDLNLPVMDGMTFLEQLRRDRPTMPVIILTGFGSLEDAKRAIRMDVVEFLTKPAHLGEIESALDRARRRLSPPQEKTKPALASSGSTQKLQDMERQAILAAIQKHDGNRSAAAVELGISRRTLYNKLAEYEKSGLISPDL
jgi:DNA-binding NtrC family response regulator